MRRRIANTIGLAIMLLAGASLWAHHNMSAVYDFNNRVSMSGTLTKFDWMNPHIELIVEAKGVKEQAETAAKAKQNAKNFENNASVITFYDRKGNIVGTAGGRALYDETAMSPDRTRVAVVTEDQEAENADLWILDIATGKSTRLTTSK